MNIKDGIFEFMEKRNYKPMKFADVAEHFNECAREDVGVALDELCMEHLVIKDRNGKYIPAEKNGFFFGSYSQSRRGFGFVRCEGRKEDIFIPHGKNLSALDSDKVIVKLLPESMGESDEGYIYRIEERCNRRVVGTVRVKKKIIFVIPDNDRLGKDIFITNKGSRVYKNDMKVVVRIKKWPKEGKNAEGDIIEVLGFAGENEAEVMSVVRENKIRYAFDRKVIEEANSKKVTDKSIENRIDFRNKKIITIDSESAKDLDDAVGIEKIKEFYRLYVHIADVSHFVTENSELDKEAFLRGTSVYFADRVIPMLPEAISNGLCSLNENEDKLTFSVVMDINGEGNVINFNICPSVIRSNHRMTYNAVNAIIEGNKELSEKYSDVYNDILTMWELCQILTDKREKRGYINFNFPETEFVFDENKKIIDVKPRSFTKANLIIEEFMIKCNETVAQFAFYSDIPFVYRVHEKPDEEKLENFRKILSALGYSVKNSKDVYPSMFNGILKEAQGKPEEKVINTMLLRAMMKARYSTENLGHFGLALKNYCHFTSPIRRYPDLAIHRILKKMLKDGVTGKTAEKYAVFAEKTAVSSSEAELKALTAERQIEDIKIAEYMEKYVGGKFSTVISSITSFGIFTEFENTAEGLLRYADIKDDYYSFNKELMCAVGERTSRVFKIGDPLTVILDSCNKKTGEIFVKII